MWGALLTGGFCRLFIQYVLVVCTRNLSFQYFHWNFKFSILQIEIFLIGRHHNYAYLQTTWICFIFIFILN